MYFNMNLSLGFILNKTAIASKSCFNNKLKEFDISPEQWSIIFRVVENPGLSQKMLSDTTYKDQSNITRSIDRLEKKSFLTRKYNKIDKRTINIFPTKKAEEIVEKIIPISEKHNQLLLNGLNDEEQNLLTLLLNKVYKNIENKEKHNV
ncbi:MarR family transcriptional regulator [Halarcobacter mediterraneus]|uniref:MarR family transcriptional regulator n=1 Tax=Halarcobacter mediterraneus TaxID=2023153 RepID=A0A4Q1AW43_9BACT|nr:MarR family transcriptional regulator [Halarcobacter mediterraneus]RXK11669.1 MarR family transcriptional regulator [Halarcobacter mediterraneus]